MRSRLVLVGAMLACASAGAVAGPTTGPDEQTFNVSMRAAPLCVLGDVADVEGEFAMGVLADRSTGLLRRDLQSPSKRLRGSFCNSPSELNVEAVLMTPVGSAGSARRGFSRGVHFTARATGWTDEPATFRTSDGRNQPAATRRQANPREADILIEVSDFAMNGGDDQRPVASRRYEGLVIVTLGPTS